jgi:hypothetical protein
MRWNVIILQQKCVSAVVLSFATKMRRNFNLGPRSALELYRLYEICGRILPCFARSAVESYPWF